MEEIPKKKNRSKDIRSFIFVLFLGVLSAFLMAGVILYYYNPSGVYTVEQVLLSPDVMMRLSGNKDGGFLVFDGIEYAYYGDKDKDWKKLPISIEKYTEFYNLIRNNKSLIEITDATASEYEINKPASIYIRVRSDDKKITMLSNKIFQEVQLLKNGDFRVELRQIDNRNRWVYFHHTELYETTQHLFVAQ